MAAQVVIEIKDIHKPFGSGSLTRLDGNEVVEVEVVAPSSIALNVAHRLGSRT